MNLPDILSNSLLLCEPSRLSFKLSFVPEMKPFKSYFIYFFNETLKYILLEIPVDFTEMYCRVAEGRVGPHRKKVDRKLTILLLNMLKTSLLASASSVIQSAVDSEVLNCDWLAEGKMAEIPKWRITGKCQIENKRAKYITTDHESQLYH